MRTAHLELLQPEDWTRPDTFSGSTAPLFLIHDGGGTTFMYAYLSPLHRFVYGISNPNFERGGAFVGGMQEIGLLYARWICETVAGRNFPARQDDDDDCVDIMLGGWSFGGLLALEVAKALADDPGVRVIGMVMVDSIYPSVKATAAPTPPPGSEKKEKTRNQVLTEQSMESARGMVKRWTMPVWGPKTQRPRAVLLRAKGFIPVASGTPDNISPLDYDRRLGGKLGWDQYDVDMFETIIDLEGHHFELFSEEHFNGTTEALRQALNLLQRMAPR